MDPVEVLPTVQEALDKLMTHGSASQIAEHLAHEGVTGYRSCGNLCVIAEYVKSATHVPFVMVSPTGELTTIHEDGRKSIQRFPGHVQWIEKDGTRSEIPIYDELDRLANSFDRGDFPALDRKRVELEVRRSSCEDGTADHVVGTGD